MPARWTGIETAGRAKGESTFVRQILAVVVPTPLSLRLAPHWGFPSRGFPLPQIQSHEAIVVQRCPEGAGEGSVLACTNVRCGIYDDVSDVPPLTPEHLEMALTVPERFRQSSIIREGETVAIPVTFHSFRPLTRELAVEFEFEVLEEITPYFDVEYEPREIVLPAGWWSRSKTTEILRVTPNRFDHEGYQAASGEGPARSFASTLGSSPPPAWSRFLVSSVFESPGRARRSSHSPRADGRGLLGVAPGYR